MGLQGRHGNSVLSPEKTHLDRGIALEKDGRFEEAAASYRGAIAQSPRSYRAWANLANALLHICQSREALDASGRAIAIEPLHPAAHNAHGSALIDLGQTNDGIAEFRRAISLQPDHPQAHANLGMALLRSGDFARGWAEYEWRRKIPHPLFDRPGRHWDGFGKLTAGGFGKFNAGGPDPFGQTLLVYGEGGLGNTIQFSRYIPQLRDMGARVILECHPELFPLMSTVRGVWKLSGRGQPMPYHDAHCPLASLPFLLGQTGPPPSQVPYLQPEASLVRRWREVSNEVGGFRIGVCWHADSHPLAVRGRSFDPAYLSRLAGIPEVKLICLQHGQPVPADVPLTVLPGLAPESMRLEDVSAVMLGLDLVISCDTSILHLAGALGVPCWGMLKRPGCWRWMLDQADSPWYPTMRLFRQVTAGCWELVSEEIAAELRWLVGIRGA